MVDTEEGEAGESVFEEREIGEERSDGTELVGPDSIRSSGESAGESKL